MPLVAVGFFGAIDQDYFHSAFGGFQRLGGGGPEIGCPVSWKSYFPERPVLSNTGRSNCRDSIKVRSARVANVPIIWPQEVRIPALDYLLPMLCSPTLRGR